jgi:hypothetical protein
MDPWCFMAALSGDEKQVVLSPNYSKGYSQTQQSHKVSSVFGRVPSVSRISLGKN